MKHRVWMMLFVSACLFGVPAFVGCGGDPPPPDSAAMSEEEMLQDEEGYDDAIDSGEYNPDGDNPVK